MTIEIEKEFFKAFGIGETGEIDLLKSEYANQSVCKKCEKNKFCDEYCDEAYESYPEITDRILLELICIINPYAPAVGDNFEELRNQVLFWCIKYKNRIYNDVRKLLGMEE